MDSVIRIVMIEDKETDAELELRELKRSGIDCDSRRVDNEADLRRVLMDFPPDIILSDFTLSGNFDGQRALEVSRELVPDTPFMFVSGTIGEEQAIESLKRGATDYVLKTNLRRLSSAVLRALEEQKTRLARQQAEDEIRQQWLFFRRVLDVDTNMVFVKDAEGRFVLANRATAEVFDATPDDMIGKTNADFIPDPIQVAKYHRDEQEVLATQQEKFIPEVELRDAGGSTRWLQTTLRPIQSPDGQSCLVMGVAVDITERKRMEDELRNNVERFEIISRATNDAVWDWDLVSNKVWWNEAFARIFGYVTSSEGTDFQFWINLLHPEDRDDVEEDVEEFINSGRRYWNGEYRFQRYDGSYAFVYDRGHIIRDDSGQPVRMIGAMMDITERYEQELRIARLNRIRDVMSGINYMIVRVRERQTLFDEACRVAVEQGDFAMAWVGMVDERTGLLKKQAIHGDDRGFLEIASFSANPDIPEGSGLISQALREGRLIVCEDVATSTDIKYQRELLERGFRSLAILPLTLGKRIIGVFAMYGQDVIVFDEAEMKLLRDMMSNISFALDSMDKERQINFLAYYDVLTGLPNDELFADRLNQVLRTLEDQRLGLLLIDIERFGYINEVFGRHAGDALLRDVAGVLQKVAGDADHVARVGADSFAVLVTGLSDAAELARYLEDAVIPQLVRPFAVGSEEFNLSIKVGAAITPENGRDAETLMRNTEAALKSAKHSGDRYMFYTSSMNAQVNEKLTLENKLRQALAREEYVLFYQPKVDLNSNRITGLEALIRWNSSEGLISPFKFIPILEATGLITEVGIWIIERAMLDYRDWRERGIEPPPIAINLSPVQLRRNDFMEQVASLIGNQGGKHEGLDMEITETMIMENMEENIDRLDILRNMGINISIDDFGTGYSSLRYMAKIPASSLKIDRSFIKDLDKNDDDKAIVSLIISLAHSLDLKVIAEGVEKLEQAELLKQMQCDQFQGYLFSPPLPFKEIETILQEHRHCV